MEDHKAWKAVLAYTSSPIFLFSLYQHRSIEFSAMMDMFSSCGD